MTWFDPNVAVSCQDWKAESIVPWQLQDDTYANISIEHCQLHPCSFPAGVGLACGTEILLSFKAYGAAALLFFNNNCLLIGGTPATSAQWGYGCIHALCDIYAGQGFNYHPSFIGSTQQLLGLTVFSGISCYHGITSICSFSLKGVPVVRWLCFVSKGIWGSIHGAFVWAHESYYTYNNQWN